MKYTVPQFAQDLWVVWSVVASVMFAVVVGLAPLWLVLGLASYFIWAN